MLLLRNLSIIVCIYFESGCFARARYDISAKVQEDFCDEFRRCLEDAHCAEGTYTLHSTAGGTGSGLTSILIEKMKEHGE